MIAWFAVYTQPRKEDMAREHLQRQNFEVFYPRYLKKRSHARKVEMVPAPLFPRYLFVSFDPSVAGWHCVRSTRGVVRIVGNNDPTVVPDQIIDNIRARAGNDGYVVLARQTEISSGARIRINSGPFSECDAIFEANHDNDRVVALLSLLGREVRIKLPIQAVVPAEL